MKLRHVARLVLVLCCAMLATALPGFKMRHRRALGLELDSAPGLVRNPGYPLVRGEAVGRNKKSKSMKKDQLDNMMKELLKKDQLIAQLKKIIKEKDETIAEMGGHPRIWVGPEVDLDDDGDDEVDPVLGRPAQDDDEVRQMWKLERPKLRSHRSSHTVMGGLHGMVM